MENHEKTSFRFPAGTTERIRRLAKHREPMASVILRALDALEAVPLPPDTQALLERIERLEVRMENLESTNPEHANHQALPVVKPATVEPGLRGYPQALKLEALKMQSEGKTTSQIRDWMLAIYCKAPNLGNMARELERWRKTQLSNF